MVGPDGVGKTTLCDALVERVERVGTPVWRVRFPGVLPRRDPDERREIRLGKGQYPDLTKPRVYPPLYSRPVALAKTLYLFVDALAGWVVKVRPLVRRGGLVVVERGWWDHAVDPRRYRLPPPASLVRPLGRFLPCVDVVVVLEADPDVIRARKPQLSEEELRRQMGAWHEVMPPRQRRVYIDASKPPDVVLAEVTAAVAPFAGPLAGGDPAGPTGREADGPRGRAS